MRIDISYMFVQSNFFNSSPIVFYQLSRKCRKINEKNSPEIEFLIFKSEIWCD
jgi:hypothetical protein